MKHTIDELTGLYRDDMMYSEAEELIAKHIKALFPSPCIAFRGSRDEFDILMPRGLFKS